ncbi:MAG: response regulator, partial [Kiritimatiellae bacterium]|nr:response regulator [Kiritimatiellia bacterium]
MKQSPSTTTNDARSSAKILVVDDEKLIRLTMKARLSRAGYEVVAVGDVNEAVTVLKENPNAFSAIITDIMMGDMDGFVFRDIVRGIDNSMPLFFLT